MKLPIYIIAEHIAPFFYSLFIITFLFIIDFLVKLLDSILTKGLDIWVILEIFVLNMAWMQALAIPMACLVASLMAFGRLASDNEVVALRALGVSPLKMVGPLIFLSVILCGSLIYFNDRILPEANHRAASLRSDITRQRAPAFITPRMLIKDFNNYQIWVDSIHYEKDLLYGVKIFIWEKREPPRYVRAKTASIEYSDDGKYIFLNLFGGENHIVDNREKEGYLRVQFKEQTIAIENVDASLVRRDRVGRTDREMSIDQMKEVVAKAKVSQQNLVLEFPAKIFKDFHAMDSLIESDTSNIVWERFANEPWWKTERPPKAIISKVRIQEKDKWYTTRRLDRRLNSELVQESQYRVEIHKKYAIPVACIIFILVGAPLGMGTRSGGLGLATILSSGFFLIYWVCLLRGEAMADKLLISPWLSMWAPNILVGVVALFLMARAMTIRK